MFWDSEEKSILISKKQNYPCLPSLLNPFPNDQILDSSNLKEFADDNFNFVENGRNLSKQVANTEGKGGIARYEQFLLFPQYFQKTRKNQGLFWKGLNLS